MRPRPSFACATISRDPFGILRDVLLKLMVTSPLTNCTMSTYILVLPRSELELDPASRSLDVRLARQTGQASERRRASSGEASGSIRRRGPNVAQKRTETG